MGPPKYKHGPSSHLIPYARLEDPDLTSDPAWRLLVHTCAHPTHTQFGEAIDSCHQQLGPDMQTVTCDPTPAANTDPLTCLSHSGCPSSCYLRKYLVILYKKTGQIAVIRCWAQPSIMWPVLFYTGLTPFISLPAYTLSVPPSFPWTLLHQLKQSHWPLSTTWTFRFASSCKVQAGSFWSDLCSFLRVHQLVWLMKFVYSDYLHRCFSGRFASLCIFLTVFPFPLSPYFDKGLQSGDLI